MHGGMTYQLLFFHEENSCVSFEVDARGTTHNLETLDRDVSLISKAETDYVEHFESENQRWGDGCED